MQFKYSSRRAVSDKTSGARNSRSGPMLALKIAGVTRLRPTATKSISSCVMFVVMTAVDGEPAKASFTSAF